MVLSSSYPITTRWMRSAVKYLLLIGLLWNSHKNDLIEISLQSG